MAANSKGLFQNQIPRVIVLVQKVKFDQNKAERIKWRVKLSAVNTNPKNTSFTYITSFNTIELVDIECVLGDISGVQILPL